ncbi:cytochrome P450 [Actinoalloteichus hymeniacidonis]|uniref:Cytochrome P450 n=1 Tax=Actinoalloteichus hymeniacidonis TaxID=340345 RepID=A0AAC9HSG1_9PSEU|nr:cytochrome P450 [Actinoalloteichus hymeniacidonis]AOS64792.1 cytochrome P450 [Actinoalloteichus hymeniacidonis]MBB5907133.1 pentalenolactone synthase [Actinoalloteichus hymeniacidonis]
MTGSVQLSLEQSRPLHIDPVVRRLQGERCIHRIRTALGAEGWLVTGYREVRQLLEDPRLGRSHPDPENAARSGESAMLGNLLGNYETERADSKRMRGLLLPQMSPRRMRELRPRIEEITTELIDGILDGDLSASDTEPVRKADLQQALAFPLPVSVICELLGVPLSDRQRYLEWTYAAALQSDRVRSEQGLADLHTYGRELAAAKRRAPADDVISRLCAIEGVDDAEVATLSMTLLFAGEAAIMALGIGTVILLQNPDQAEALRQDPQLIPGAVEEILRSLDKGGDGIIRYARADVEVDGLTIRAGDLVLLDTGAANHDSTIFAEPDAFDIQRAANSHLAFGHGTYYCVGTALARIELQVAFEQIITRFPKLRLAVPAEELRLDREIVAGGLVELPVTW